MREDPGDPDIEDNPKKVSHSIEEPNPESDVREEIEDKGEPFDGNFA